MFKHGVRLAIARGRSRVVGSQYARRQLVELLRREKPDVLVVNEDRDGFVLNAIAHPTTQRPCIIAFVDDDIGPLQIAILHRLGVLGFLHRTATTLELRTALRHVSNGRPFASSQIELHAATLPWLDTSDFDAFDLRILNALALGTTLVNTAAAVGLKVSTVKYRRKKLYRSLDVRNWRQAVDRLEAYMRPRTHGAPLPQWKRHDRDLPSAPPSTPGDAPAPSGSAGADQPSQAPGRWLAKPESRRASCKTLPPVR